VSKHPQLHFHFGAHKTATTYMQSLLRNNRQTLHENGVSVVDLWDNFDGHTDFRNAVMNAMWEDNPGVEDVEKFVRILKERFNESAKFDKHQVIDTYVISFENIIGSYQLSNTKGIYPYAA
jgi:hypothetical protein